MRLPCKVFAVVLATLTVAGAAQAQTTLRYKFKEGAKHEYIVDLDQKMSMNLLGMDIDMKQVMVMEIACQTLKVDDNGSAQHKVTLGRVKMVVEGGPLGKIEVDSKDTEEPDSPFGKIFQDIIKSIGGMEMTFTADPTGAISDVKVTEGKKMKKLPGVGGLGGGGVDFGPETLKSLVDGSIFVPLPKEPVSKGKTWTQKLDTKTQLGKMTGENKYTYEGETENNLQKFSVKPDMKLESDPNAQIQVKMKKGAAKGVTLFDNRAGRVAQANTEATMQMEIEAMGQTISADITQTTTMRLKGAKKTERPKD
jgi:hypothetical protein